MGLRSLTRYLVTYGAMQALAEKKRMHEEAKALELKKREELHVEKFLSDAEVCPDRNL